VRKEKACPCGQAEDPRARELTAWIAEHRDEPGVALPALQKAQDIYGFLPVEAQRIVAEELGKPLSEVYGIATFYSMFSLTPKGRNHISVCLGPACYVKGGGHIYELLQQKLGIEGGGCTSDGRFSLDACRCLGCCGMAPVIMVNSDVYGSLTGDELDAILDKYR